MALNSVNILSRMILYLRCNCFPLPSTEITNADPPHPIYVVLRTKPRSSCYFANTLTSWSFLTSPLDTSFKLLPSWFLILGGLLSQRSGVIVSYSVLTHPFCSAIPGLWPKSTPFGLSVPGRIALPYILSSSLQWFGFIFMTVFKASAYCLTV